MKFYGVKKVVGEAKRLENTRMNWTVYLNKKTNHVWLREYAGCCSWMNYNPTIISTVITRERYGKEYCGQLNMATLQLILEQHLIELAYAKVL